jgi:hypothetical protein
VPAGLEQLEVRLVPTSLLWVGPPNVFPNDTSPNTAANWISQTGAHQVPTPSDSLVFDPGQTYAGVWGSNPSPSGTLDSIGAGGNFFSGLHMDPTYTGNLDAGNKDLLFDGNVSILGGTLQGRNGHQIILGRSGNADVLTFGSGYPGASPDLEMNVLITTDENTRAAVTLNVAGPGTINATVTNDGDMTFLNGTFTVVGPSIVNTSSGQVQIQGSETFGGPGYQLANIGVLRKTVGTGTATTGSSFLNQGEFDIWAGTMHLTNTLPTQSQEAGGPVPNTELRGGGTLWVDSPYTVLGGWVSGVGTIQGVLDNGDPTGLQAGAGTVHPGFLSNGGQSNPDGTVGGGGLITVTGDYQQTSSGVLWIDITQSQGGSSMGRLQVNGTAYLAGIAQIVRGSQCTPNLGAGNFAFINWGNVNGDFASVSIANNSWVDVNGAARSFKKDLQNDGYYLVVQ